MRFSFQSRFSFNADATAKRLCNLAQGCRAARLPWDTGLTIATPTGLRLLHNRIFSRNPVGVVPLPQLDPRVAARRGNPGLSYITASRFWTTLKLKRLSAALGTGPTSLPRLYQALLPASSRLPASRNCLRAFGR